MYIYEARDELYLSKLKDCIEEYYNILIQTIQPARRGTYGETWKISTSGNCYFVKIHYSTYILDLYKESLVTIDILWNHGIDYISHVLKTRNNELCTCFHGGLLAVFNFVDGETKKLYHIVDLYRLLAKIYTVPVTNLKLQTEQFSSDCAYSVMHHIDDIPLLAKNKGLLESYAQRLDKYSKLCMISYDNLYITHGDSISNVINDGDKLIIIDWDYAKISCPERDVWFLIQDVNQIEELNQILLKANIDYRLKKERLIYHCYYNYFYYLQHHIYEIKSFSDEAYKKIIEKYIRHFFFGGNIVKQIHRIESICEIYHE